MRLLFICSRNKLRSPTAEAIFADPPRVETDSAGLNHDSEVRLTPAQLLWADLILVMEPVHRDRLHRLYREFLGRKRVEVLGIPDRYDFMDEDLISLLKSRCARYLT